MYAWLLIHLLPPYSRLQHNTFLFCCCIVPLLTHVYALPCTLLVIIPVQSYNTYRYIATPTQLEHHRSHWIHPKGLEGECTSCTNQALYSLVCMCTPCSKPHPPPNWRSRSRVVVTSYHVLIGLNTGAVHTHMVHIYVCQYSMYIFVQLHHPVLSVIPLWLKANSQMTPSLLLPTR